MRIRNRSCPPGHLDNTSGQARGVHAASPCARAVSRRLLRPPAAFGRGSGVNGALRSAGNVLIVVIMTAGLVTAGVAGYLALTTRQNESVMRSLCWNAALPLAEAGVEEALSHLHKNNTNCAADGWTLSGTNYTKQRDRKSVV